MDNKICILTKEVVERKLSRMALEIVEQLNGNSEPIVLIGVRENGFVIAEKVQQLIGELISADIKLIGCKLNKKQPDVIEFSEPVDFNNVSIILVDDVSNSGKTLLYTLKPLLNFHPKRIQTLVLVERMHKTFPIKPDYVGLSVATTLQDHIQVEVVDGAVDGAYLM